jgi:hypothetical protein
MQYTVARMFRSNNAPVSSVQDGHPPSCGWPRGRSQFPCRVDARAFSAPNHASLSQFRVAGRRTTRYSTGHGMPRTGECYNSIQAPDTVCPGLLQAHGARYGIARGSGVLPCKSYGMLVEGFMNN